MLHLIIVSLGAGPGGVGAPVCSSTYTCISPPSLPLPRDLVAEESIKGSHTGLLTMGRLG